MYHSLRIYFILMTVCGSVRISYAQGNSGDSNFVRHDQCGGEMEEVRAIVTSPNYPKTEDEISNVYESSMDCEWEKSAHYPNSLFRIKIFDLNLEKRSAADGSNRSICYDYVNITVASFGTLQYCGWNAPTELITGLGPKITVNFHSDEERNYRGFMLIYQCIPNYMPCEPNPCENGKCRVFKNGIDYNCACQEGFTGPLCDKDVKECSSSPCLNGGVCVELRGGFNCSCADGWEGSLCEIEKVVDPCQSNPCAESATCESDGNSFVCHCVDGFEGILCKEEIDECSSSPCLNEGLCTDKINSFKCTCLPGWGGEICNEIVDPCSLDPCESFQVCEVVQENKHRCVCPHGYEGLGCKDDINDCESEPCKNGGICNDKVGWFECQCKNGFTGPNCTIAPTKCSNPGIPFVSNETEWIAGATLQFYCAEGYTLQGEMNLTCTNESTWTSNMPVCVVDRLNNTVHFLPSRFTPVLVCLVSVASALGIVLLSFSIWILLKGPWKIGMQVTKVMKLSRVSLSSY